MQFTVAGMEGALYPRIGVFLFFAVACVFFAGGPILLMKALSNSWMKNLEIMGKPVEVNESNKPIILKGICATGLSLLLTIAAMLVPTPDLRLERMEVLGGFVIGVIGSFGSAIWTSRKLRSLGAEE